LEGKEERACAVILQSEEGIALDSISAGRTGFVIVGGEY